MHYFWLDLAICGGRAIGGPGGYGPLLFSEKILQYAGHGRCGIVVIAHASRAEGLQFESDPVATLGDKGGEERNWPPYLKCRWLRISVLSNRHSPTYGSIRDCLYLLCRTYTLNPKTDVNLAWPPSTFKINLRPLICFCRSPDKVFPH